MLPLLIADSGGTKTDWCYVDASGSKHFFETESYHPIHWSTEFEQRIQHFWNENSQYKDAQVHLFCAGCLRLEKSDQLTQLFNNLGFSDVVVKSDLHAAALSLYGNQNGFCAILGTGSVFFEWKNEEVNSILGGKGHEEGDEGSGFFFGKLVFQAYQENKLSPEQRRIFEEKVDIKQIETSLQEKTSKTAISQISKQLFEYSNVFSEWHLRNIELFFDEVLNSQTSLNLQVVGGYFTVNSAMFIPYLAEKHIQIQNFTSRPIDSLVDYFLGINE